MYFLRKRYAAKYISYKLIVPHVVFKVLLPRVPKQHRYEILSGNINFQKYCEDIYFDSRIIKSYVESTDTSTAFELKEIML